MYHQNKKPVICVSGAAEMGSCGDKAPEIAKEIGEEIAKAGCILTTGATTGFPQWCNVGAKEANGYTIGISPAATEEEHLTSYRLPTDHMDFIMYTGFGFPGRDLLLVRSSEAVIFGCGRIGTIHEFTIAFEDNKPIGILEGNWKTDEVIHHIIKEGNRPTDHVIFDTDPHRLVNKIKDMVIAKREKNLREANAWRD
jgi:uncharacterized protein (TIGR00725 family)